MHNEPFINNDLSALCTPCCDDSRDEPGDELDQVDPLDQPSPISGGRRLDPALSAVASANDR